MNWIFFIPTSKKPECLHKKNLLHLSYLSLSHGYCESLCVSAADKRWSCIKCLNSIIKGHCVSFSTLQKLLVRKKTSEQIDWHSRNKTLRFAAYLDFWKLSDQKWNEEKLFLALQCMKFLSFRFYLMLLEAAIVYLTETHLFDVESSEIIIRRVMFCS